MPAETIIRKWGNSLGVILPHELVEQQHLKEKDKVIIALAKEGDLSDIFGSLPRTISGQKFKDVVREGWEK